MNDRWNVFAIQRLAWLSHGVILSHLSSGNLCKLEKCSGEVPRGHRGDKGGVLLENRKEDGRAEEEDVQGAALVSTGRPPINGWPPFCLCLCSYCDANRSQPTNMATTASRLSLVFFSCDAVLLVSFSRCWGENSGPCKLPGTASPGSSIPCIIGFYYNLSNLYSFCVPLLICLCLY